MKTLADFKFKQLDSEKAMKLLEGHKDTITPLAKAQHVQLQKETCSKCGGPLKVTLSSHPFGAGQVLPRYVGECKDCHITGIIINA